MGKWLWRFLVAKNQLWARVVRACHGSVEWGPEGFFSGNRRSVGFGWWKKVLTLGFGNEGKWLWGNLGFKVGGGAEIRFWHHSWIGTESLKSLFPRLFLISKNQDDHISEMGEWLGDAWVWKLGWRRDLYEWESEMAEQLMSMINNVSLVAGSIDEWRWSKMADGAYSVRSAYLELCSANRGNQTQELDMKMLTTIWKAPAPQKTITTAWRILKNKIPTCDNLLKRRVTLPFAETKCTICKSSTESANHLFFSCDKTMEIWRGVLGWLGIHSALPASATDHFTMFSNLGRLKMDKKFLTSLWICVVWLIWKRRNDCKFGNIEWDNDKILPEIKARLWSWCKAYDIPMHSYNFDSWFQSAKLEGFR